MGLCCANDDDDYEDDDDVIDVCDNNTTVIGIKNALEVKIPLYTTYWYTAASEAILSACRAVGEGLNCRFKRLQLQPPENQQQHNDGVPTATATKATRITKGPTSRPLPLSLVVFIILVGVLTSCTSNKVSSVAAEHSAVAYPNPKTAAIQLHAIINGTTTRFNTVAHSINLIAVHPKENGGVVVPTLGNTDNINNYNNEVILPARDEFSTNNIIIPPLSQESSSTLIPSLLPSFNVTSSIIATTNSAPNITSESSSHEPQIPAYIRTTAMFFCIVIMLMGVIGNVMVPIVIIRTKDMRNSTNIFLTNLSIADLLVLLVCTPTVLVELNTRPETWILGHEMCKAVPFIELTVAHASVLTILAISFERYYAICEPLKAGYVCTKTRAILICSLAWGVAASFTSPIILIATYRLEPYYDGSIVAVCFTSAGTFWSAFYFIGSITVFFLVPFAILVLLYSAIAYKLLRRHSEFERPTSPNIYNAATAGVGIATATANAIMSPAQQKALIRRRITTNVNSHPQNRNLSKHRQQVIFMLVTVVSSFFVCLLPFKAFTLWVIASSDETVASLGLEGYYNVLYFCRIMLYLNSALNPILYNLMSSKFRGGFRRLIVSCCCSRKHERHRGLCNRHNATTHVKRPTYILDNTNSLRARRPLKREATFVVNSSSISSSTERTSTTWRSGSLSTSVTGNSKAKAPESHSLAAAITDMSTTAVLTTMYFT